MPLVSVVIATYRRPALMARAVACAIGQTMSDLEVIVVAARDDSDTISAVEMMKDPRVRCVVNPEKKGPGQARDTGVKASAAQWIAFLDDDDEWAPDKLEKQIASAPDSIATISMTLSSVVTPVGTFVRPADPYMGAEPIDEWLFDRRSWFKGGQSMLQTSSLLVPRALFEKIGFGEARHEEWELVIRAVKQLGFRLITVREPLVTYYAGNTYPWKSSADWIETVRDVITPRAYAGFCLTVATQGLDTPDRNQAFLEFTSYHL